MKKFNVFMTIFTVVMLVIGCASKNQVFNNVEVTFLEEGQTISTEDFHTYTVQLTDQNGEGFNADVVYMYMNMKGMNHPIEGTMQRVKDGVYQLELPLAMAGEWYVNISITVDDETEVIEDFTVIAEGDHQMEFIKGYAADQE